MIIKDPEARKVLKRANSEIIDEMVDSYPEDEIDNKSDLEIVLDEISYLVWKYEDDGTIQYEDLSFSKQVIKETDNGKSMPVLLPDFKFKYTKQEVQDAIDTVAEYKRLKKILKEYGWA